MPSRALGVVDETPGASVVDYRVRERTVGGLTGVGEQYVLQLTDRVPTFKGSVGMPRVILTAVGAPLLSLFNRTGSGALVAVRRVLLVQTNTTNSGTVRALTSEAIFTEPAGGTVYTPMPFDTGLGTQNVNVVCKGTASDDGVANAFTAVTRGGRAWTQMSARMAGITEQVLPVDGLLVPGLAATDPAVLAPGEGALFSYAGADTPSSSAHHALNVMWEEYLLP